MIEDETVKKAFDKLFGDMGLADNDVAMHIFELGYIAGITAENEACAKVCDEMDHDGVMVAADCAAAIRARMNDD